MSFGRTFVLRSIHAAGLIAGIAVLANGAGTFAQPRPSRAPAPPPLELAALERIPWVLAWPGKLRTVTVRLTSPKAEAGEDAARQALFVEPFLDEGPGWRRPSSDDHPETRPEQVVLVFVDRAGRPLGWQQSGDPRRVRSEHADPDGTMHGGMVMEKDGLLDFTFPDNPAIRAAHIYAVEGTGTASGLTPLAVWRRR